MSSNNESFFFEDERTAVLIDGTAIYSASRNVGVDIDYKALSDMFMHETSLACMNYYVAVLDTDAYTPVKPLTDWLSYNGYNLTLKKAWESTNDFTGARRVHGSVLAEMATDITLLAASGTIQHIVLFASDINLCYPVEMAQKLRGVRVTVVGPLTAQPRVPDELRRKANKFIDFNDIRHRFQRINANGVNSSPRTVQAA